MTVTTNTIYYDTAVRIEYIYNGAFYLSAHPMVDNYQILDPISASADIGFFSCVPGFGIYLDRIEMGYYVTGGTALDSSNKWAITLTAEPVTHTVHSTITIQSGTTDAWHFAQQTNPTTFFSGANFIGIIRATKTGTPGTLKLGMRIQHRILRTAGT